MFKNWIRGLLALGKLIIGLLNYLVFKRTPAFGHQAMISLFCFTSGYSNDLLSKIISYFERPYHLAEPSGILGAMTESRRSQVLTKLNEEGYFIFEERLPEELCDRLLKFATSQVCSMRPMDGDILGKPVRTQYHREAPQSVRYDFDTQDVIDNHDIQNLFADMSLVAVAQDYLKARPVIDVTSMWWHTAFSDKPDSEAAQYYHFDMDRPKWLKFFIYLTDVEQTNGPHTFVAGSHKSGGIPLSLLKKGYARLTDEDVMHNFDKNKIVEFTAPRGTIIAEDSRGLHKGRHVENGDRLMLQIQFSNSLFGGYYSKVRLGNNMTDELKVKITQFPELYSAYVDFKS